jgi:hypothetical protein
MLQRRERGWGRSADERQSHVAAAPASISIPATVTASCASTTPGSTADMQEVVMRISKRLAARTG